MDNVGKRKEISISEVVEHLSEFTDSDGVMCYFRVRDEVHYGNCEMCWSTGPISHYCVKCLERNREEHEEEQFHCFQKFAKGLDEKVVVNPVFVQQNFGLPQERQDDKVVYYERLGCVVCHKFTDLNRELAAARFHNRTDKGAAKDICNLLDKKCHAALEYLKSHEWNSAWV